MPVFNLYVSGILYGKVDFALEAPRIRRLDVFTGSLGDWEPITPEISGEYKSFLKMDFLTLAKHTGEYVQAPVSYTHLDVYKRQALTSGVA